MDGPDIIVASLSVPQPRGPSKAPWQYHSRSDLHSKVACWAVLFDLLQQSALMRRHATSGKIVFGINHELRDFATGRKKVLDLVIARPAGPTTKETLVDLAQRYRIVLDNSQATKLAALPDIHRAPVGAVLMALEAKAAMTEHVKALPRLYDELNSSHQTVHGASRQALAVGLVMVNASSTFVSPDLNKTPGAAVVLSKHSQPAAAAAVVAKVREIPRRTASATEGYDGLGIIVISAINDGTTPVALITAPPAPPPRDIFYYDNMITRRERVRHYLQVDLRQCPSRLRSVADRGTPAASSPDALRRMKSQRQRDTAAERALRSLLHSRGFRFRVDYTLPALRRRADIAFPRLRVAVFVDGCFWHGCPEHGTWPKQNAEWWREKIEANRRRDADTDAKLEERGWRVIRVWEHDAPETAARTIEDAVARAEGHRAGI